MAYPTKADEAFMTPTGGQRSLRRPPQGGMALPGMVPPGGAAEAPPGGPPAGTSGQPYGNPNRDQKAAESAAGVAVVAAAAELSVTQQSNAGPVGNATTAGPSGPGSGPPADYGAPPPSYDQSQQHVQQSGYVQGSHPQTAYPQQSGSAPMGTLEAAAADLNNLSRQTVYVTTTSGGLGGPATVQGGTVPQVMVVATHPEKINNWQQGLCGCFKNCSLCLMSYFCSCYVIGKNAEAVGHSFILYCLGSLIPIGRCLLQANLRAYIRDLRGIRGTAMDDICYVMCCNLCALTQEAAEVEEIKLCQTMERE